MIIKPIYNISTNWTIQKRINQYKNSVYTKNKEFLNYPKDTIRFCADDEFVNDLNFYIMCKKINKKINKKIIEKSNFNSSKKYSQMHTKKFREEVLKLDKKILFQERYNMKKLSNYTYKLYDDLNLPKCNHPECLNISLASNYKNGWASFRNQFKKIEKNHVCKCCNKNDVKLELHEIFSYDPLNHVIIVDDIIPLCKECHTLQHMSRFMSFLPLTKQETIDRMCNRLNVKNENDLDSIYIKSLRVFGDIIEDNRRNMLEKYFMENNIDDSEYLRVDNKLFDCYHIIQDEFRKDNCSSKIYLNDSYLGIDTLALKRNIHKKNMLYCYIGS